MLERCYSSVVRRWDCEDVMPLIFCVELVRLEVATCIRCSLAVLGRWSYRWLALGIFLECLYHILGAVAYGLAVAGNLRDGHQGCRYGAYQQHRKGWARDVHYLHLADAMCSFTEDLCANLALKLLRPSHSSSEGILTPVSEWCSTFLSATKAAAHIPRRLSPGLMHLWSPYCFS